MRIESYLSRYTSFSRRDIEKLITKKLVKINGEIIKKGLNVNESDEFKVEVNDVVIPVHKNIYILLNKPKGTVCANKDKNHKTIFEILGDEFKKDSLFTIGRLDIDTEGLIIVTNDGQLSHRLRSPKWKIDKKYYVMVDNVIDHKTVEEFKKGIRVGDEFTAKPSLLELETETSCYLTIQEGKFHQIKRMFWSLGFSVDYLKRVSFGTLILDPDLKLGDYRFLTTEEILDLKKSCNLK